MFTRLLSAGAVLSLLAITHGNAASPGPARAAKANLSATPAAAPLEPGQLSELSLPEGISALCVVRVQKVIEAFRAKGLESLCSGFLSEIDESSPPPLRRENLISATVAWTDAGGLMILYALREPAEIAACEGASPLPAVCGWKTSSYREYRSSFCQITPGNVLFLLKEGMREDDAQNQAELIKRLPRFVRAMSECRARTAKLPVAYVAGPQKGWTAKGSFMDGLRKMAVELETEPELALKGRLDFTSGARLGEVARDIDAAWPFLSRMPGIPDAPPEMKFDGTQLNARLELPPAVLMAESLADAKIARRLRNQRNAMNIVSVYQSAVSCGASAVREAKSLEEIIRLLQQGVTMENPGSPFHGKTFSIGKLTPEAVGGAARYIISDKNGLDYFQFVELDDIEPSRQAATYAHLTVQMWNAALRQKLVDGSGLQSPQDVLDRLAGVQDKDNSRLAQAYFSLTPEQLTRVLPALKVDEGELNGENPPGLELDAYQRLSGKGQKSPEEARFAEGIKDALDIVALFKSAKASGAAGLDRVTSVEEATRLLRDGVEVDDQSSPVHGKRFSLGKIGNARLRQATRHLMYEEDELRFNYDQLRRW